MAARIFPMADIAGGLRAEARLRAARLRTNGIVPVLAIVQLRRDEWSDRYIARKCEDCAGVEIAVRHIVLPPDIRFTGLERIVAALNADPDVHGILIQLPLPPHLDAEAVAAVVAPAKDADGLHPFNLAALSSPTPRSVPCTVRAIAHLLSRHAIGTDGARAAVIGRGRLVGRPAACLLSGTGPCGNAEVTVLHRRSPDLADTLARADIVIAAAGHPGLVRASMLKPGAAVIGVGMCPVNGLMIGDLAADVPTVASWTTAPEEGFGEMTRMHLLHNLLDLAEIASVSP